MGDLLSLSEAAEFLGISRPTFNARRLEHKFNEITEGNKTMQNIILKNFGLILTGRPYGVQIYSELQKEYGNVTEVEFDLSGVASIRFFVW